MIDGITEAMREIFETTENDMIARANLALIKGAPINEVRSQLIQDGKIANTMMDKAVKKAAALGDFSPDKIIKNTKDGTAMLIASAGNYYKSALKNVERLRNTDKLHEAIFRQTQFGINNGIKVVYKDKRTMGYKEYMEMNIRTTIQNEIGETQLRIGSQNNIVFYLCNVYADCADDHADYQGKMYYDERYKSFGVGDEVGDFITRKGLLSVQEVRDELPFLTTRPNCRHDFMPITIEQALGENVDKMLVNLKLKKGTYKPKNYEKTQQQRNNERNIRFYKARRELNEKMYKEMPSSRFLEQISKDKVLVSKWQAKQRSLINDNPDLLQRDYRRETRDILLNDLGVKYNL